MKNDIFHIHFNTVDSTNTEARRQISSHSITAPTLITADTQTAGRGRMGRSFYSPDKTGLYMSLVFKADGFSEAITRVTTAAAVSVYEAIRRIAEVDVRIKWVNDLYLDDKKICGILCESAVDDLGDRYIIVGIGINLNTRDFPEGLRAPAGSVFSNLDTLPEALAQTLALDISNRLLDKLESGEPSHDLEIYRQHSYLDGRRVVCTVGDTSVEGVAIGIGEDFSLLVQTDGGEMLSISSGEATVKVTS